MNTTLKCTFAKIIRILNLQNFMITNIYHHEPYRRKYINHPDATSRTSNQKSFKSTSPGKTNIIGISKDKNKIRIGGYHHTRRQQDHQKDILENVRSDSQITENVSSKENEISRLRTEVKQKESRYSQLQGIIDQVAFNAGFKSGGELIRTFTGPEKNSRDFSYRLNSSKSNVKSLLNV